MPEYLLDSYLRYLKEEKRYIRTFISKAIFRNLKENEETMGFSKILAKIYRRTKVQMLRQDLAKAKPS